MLVRLHIHNLALIERAELELASGLNVLTGETGAGKTMLAQAIGLLTGAQPVAGMVGPYGDEAYVEAEFDTPADLFDDHALAAVAGLRPDGEEALVVARRLTAAGRSRAFVWGRGCARADLEALGERLIEMSSQHEALLALRLQLPQRLQLVLVEEPRPQLELSLDIRLVGAGADEARFALRAEQEPDRLREDRLPGAGLARNRVQPCAGLELRLADEHQVLDAESTKHATRPNWPKGHRDLSDAASGIAAWGSRSRRERVSVPAEEGGLGEVRQKRALLAEPNHDPFTRGDLRHRAAVDEHLTGDVGRAILDLDVAAARHHERAGV